MKKIILFVLVLFAQNNLTAQNSDSKLLQLNKRAELKGKVSATFLKELNAILPDANFNPNELIIIHYFSSNEGCPEFMTNEMLEENAIGFQNEASKIVKNNTLTILATPSSTKEEQKIFKELSQLVEKNLLPNQHHCFNRILIYKNTYISLLGDYNDDEALQRIKKMSK